MLWSVRVSWGKKLALIGMFSLTVIVIIVSIIRIAVVTSKTVQADVTWLYMWGLIEMAVGMLFFARHKSMSTTTNAIVQKNSCRGILPRFFSSILCKIRSSSWATKTKYILHRK